VVDARTLGRHLLGSGETVTLEAFLAWAHSSAGGEQTNDRG
jgi:hypothetical protein